MRIFRHVRPPPALVVASIALLLALGGTSLAAKTALAPRNSVGSPQVIDRSLLKKDFAPAQLPAGARGRIGARGPVGPTGPTGPAGAAGVAGPVGPAGPSDAYARSVTGPLVLPTSPASVANLAIPLAGKYVLSSKLYASGAGTAVISCRLTPAGQTAVFDESKGTAYGAANPDTVTNLLAYEFQAAGSVDLQCQSSVGGSTASHIRIAAIKVANLTTS